MISNIKTLSTLAMLCAMVVLFVLTLGDVASDPDAPRPVISSAASFAHSTSPPPDPGTVSQAIGDGLDLLEVSR